MYLVCLFGFNEISRIKRMDIEKLELIGSREACNYLKVGLSRLSRLVKDYNIPYKEISGRKFFLLPDIKAFQRGRRDKLKHRGDL